ncbi:ABC transporter ATP-binding protein [Microcella alkalica]|uniref:ABC transporter ATP-binding protein n=1 Tax=Microcella alkalica TaxID=355930 RepID=UPI00145DCF9D|nr:ABC transporter ATP-binding protein [Microcella alkalica]
MKATWRLYRDVTAILPARARRFLLRYSVLLGLLSVLDAAALAILAVVIGPIVAGTPLTLPIIGRVDTLGMLLLLGLVCVAIIAKGVFALALSWRATRVFSTYELELGARLFDSYLASSWVERLKRNSADIVRLTDSSVSTTISGFVLPTTLLVGELLSFVTVVVVLAIAQPVVAAIALAYLGMLGAVLFFWVTRRAREAGQVALRFSLRSTRLITEMVGALKEVTLRAKADEAAAVVRSNRERTTRARANSQFLAQVPRYVLDSGIIGGFALVGVAGYLMDGLTGALTAIALFGLAGFRMAPSIVRFQGIVSQVSVSTPHAQAVLAEIRRSEAATTTRDREEAPLPEHPRTLRFEAVGFRYAADAPEAVREVSLEIPFGSTVAFVGSSGAGKSTMIDLLLGLIEPTSGRIEIDGVELSAARAAWRRRVGYVPQDVSLFDATIAQNVALTWTDGYDLERVRRALELAQMLETVEAREGGVHARVGERGLALSGGQRQRLGIARALYADPLVLVMDEATSALDTATEAAVTDAIRTLRGSMTIITVAHRLSTVLESDIIFFMRDGEVAARGTFDELVRTVPDFAHQARLAGLAGQ